MTAPRPLWLVAAPFAFLVFWSLGYSVAKIGLQYTQPMTLLALRFACVLVVMGIFFAILRPPLPKKPADWGHLAFVGFLIQTIYFGGTYFAFQAGVAAGTVALLTSFHPILLSLVAPRWSGEHVGRLQWVGLVLGLLGAIVVIVGRSSISMPPVSGLLLCGIGLLGITAGSLWEKRFGLNHHPVTANLIGFAAGFLGIVPALFFMDTISVDWTQKFSAALAYLVLVNSVIAVWLLLAMIRAGDVARVSALFFLVPPLAAFLAIFFLGEPMPPVAWAGMALAAIGVFLAARK